MVLGYWLLVIGCWFGDNSCYFLVVSCWFRGRRVDWSGRRGDTALADFYTSIGNGWGHLEIGGNGRSSDVGGDIFWGGLFPDELGGRVDGAEKSKDPGVQSATLDGDKSHADTQKQE